MTVSVPPCEPLSWPDGDAPNSGSEWALPVILAVFLGSLVAGCVHRWLWCGAGLVATVAILQKYLGDMRRRGLPTFEGIARQLAARHAFPAQLWGSPDRAAFAEFVAKAIADEIGWPTAHFAPDDPFEIAFFRPISDGGEVVVVVHEAEKKLRRRARGSGEDWGRIRTVGQFVDLILGESSSTKRPLR